MCKKFTLPLYQQDQSIKTHLILFPSTIGFKFLSLISGNSIYGIKGTKDAKELFEEVEVNALYIQKLTGRKPKFFRSGTAYYDEYAVAQIYDMKFKPIGFNILGDAGATYSAQQIKDALLKSKAGDIIIAHANHPEKQTGKGLKSVLPLLKAQGFKFVKLEDYIK